MGEMFNSTLLKVECPPSKGHWKDVIFKGIDDKFS